MNDSGAIELYRRYRPSSFKQVLGQEKAVTSLETMLRKGKTPRAIMFSGPTGCGKSTLGYILQDKLKCSDADFNEIDCAAIEKPIDCIRTIRATMNTYPMNGDCRMWLFEEVQALSRAGFAQQALLKILEHTPPHCYFLLTTSDPSKVIPAIRTRCTEIRLSLLSNEVMTELIQSVAKQEGKKFSEEVIEKIVEVAEGSARKAIVVLHQIADLPEEEQLDSIQSNDSQKQSKELGRLLMDNRTKWPSVSSILRGIEEEPETMRRMILGYASAVLVNKVSERAYLILTVFSDPLYDTGKPGLVKACYEVVRTKD